MKTSPRPSFFSRFGLGRRSLVALIAILGLCAPLAAQPGGVLTGVVTDDTGAFVTGAVVTVGGLTAATDRGGRYRIAGVPAGSQQVTVSYLGFNPETGPVAVAAGGETVRNVVLKTGALVMDAFVVASIAEGQARAINQQRASDTIKNIVTADKLGSLPDANIGEAMSRMPGIGLQFDRGEAEYITVRGAAPKFNSVALNGDRMPSFFSPVAGGRDDRAVRLDTLPTELISRIEVTKAVTADLDADSVGGAVNLQTKSVLDFNRRVFSGSFQHGINDLDRETQTAATATFGTRLGSGGRYGVLVTGSYQYNNRPVHAVNLEYQTGTIGGVFQDTLLNQIDVRHRITDRKRLGGSAQFDYKLGENSRHYVRFLKNDYTDNEERRRFRYRFGSGGTYLPGSNATSGAVDGGRLEHQDRKSSNERDIHSAGFGGDFTLPRAEINYQVAYNRADAFLDRTETTWENRRPTGPAAAPVVDYTYNRADVNFPRFTDPLNSVNDKAAFVLGANPARGSYLIRKDQFDEDDISGALNVKIPARFGEHSGHWKFGWKSRLKERDVNTFADTYRPTTTLRLADFLDDARPNVRGIYNYGPTTNDAALRAFFAANRAGFVRDEAAFINNNVPLRYDATEDIHALYGMASATLGRLTLIGGLRGEQTKNDYTGNIVTTTPTGALRVTATSATSDYTNVFPSLVGTFRVTERFLVRGAWTNTIARPDYGDLTPRRLINDQNNTISDGNPALKPMKSMGFDVSVEWYLSSAGLVSAGVFHKELKNFRFLQSGPIQFDAGSGPETFTRTQPFNGPKGSLTGLELNWQQRLKFLPGFLRHFGITANATFIRGEGEVPGRGTLKHLPDQVNRVFNAILDYERAPFTARVAYNFNGTEQNTFAGAALDDQFTDRTESIDASVGYALRAGWKLFVDAKNLTDSGKRRYYLGNRTRPIEQEYTGYSLIGGVKFDF
jgi:TonB-dependent receptor